MRITDLCQGDTILSKATIGIITYDMPLIVLGSSQSTNSVILLSEKGLMAARMSIGSDPDDYFSSDIDRFLNAGFLIEYVPESLNHVLVGTRVITHERHNGIEKAAIRKVFLPSMYELGYSDYAREGLNYGTPCVAGQQAISIRKNMPVRYWTRSVDGGRFLTISSRGSPSMAESAASYYASLRPCFSVSVRTEVAPVLSGSDGLYYKIVGMKEERRVIQEDLFMRLMTL